MYQKQKKNIKKYPCGDLDPCTYWDGKKKSQVSIKCSAVCDAKGNVLRK